VTQAIPPWLIGAIQDIGVTEIKGRKHSPRIIEMHGYTQLRDNALRDEVPWCSSAMNAWLIEAGFPGTRSALAASWIAYGREAVGDELGAVCVIRRRKGRKDESTRTGYHVGNFLNRSKNGIVMVSGNASNRVGADHYSLALWELVALRMPEDWSSSGA